MATTFETIGKCALEQKQNAKKEREENVLKEREEIMKKIEECVLKAVKYDTATVRVRVKVPVYPMDENKTFLSENGYEIYWVRNNEYVIEGDFEVSK